MIAASTSLPSASCKTMAASSIHGTGAQNFASTLRNGRGVVSGMALEPSVCRRRRASSLVRPLCRPCTALAGFAAPVPTTDRASVIEFDLGSTQAPRTWWLRRALLNRVD